MRIKQLKITEFKNLRNFQIDFEPSSFTSVLVGRNGTGKSNLLEALVVIFKELDLGLSPTIKYEIKYSCRGHEVSIDADPERTGSKVYANVDGKKLSSAIFRKKGRGSYLPRYVFGYYSGPGNRMEQHFDQHQKRFYNDLLKGEVQPLRPLLYARHVHSQFVLMAFFSEQDQELLNFLSKHLRIEAFDSALFVTHRPPWKSSDGDERFWYARGVVSDFLGHLYRLSLAPLRIDRRIPVDFRRSRTLEHLFLYLRDLGTLQDLASVYETPQQFFKALESTYISQLISEVRIRVWIRNAKGSLTFHELSEGEQQLLMVLGLLRFTKEEDSLFLLDEPDTHLNPAWSIQYLDFLNSVAGDQATSQIIMATHDPLVMLNMRRSQIRIFRFEEGSDQIIVDIPEYDPEQMGASEILTSELFGLRATTSTRLQRLLSEKRMLAIKDELSDAERDRLAELNQELEGFDFTSAVRDPLYEPYVDAMSELEERYELSSTTLTEKQRVQRRELAKEILNRLKTENKVKS